MTTPNKEDLLDRVRKLLAKAEDEGCTPAEAEALTAKASELMARYGIERAQIGALHPETDKPGSKIFDIPNPWGKVKAHLLAGLASAMRGQCVLLGAKDGAVRLHVFAYSSDIERTEMMWTSLLVQMQRALAQEQVPVAGSRVKAWRRSWMLGYATAVVVRVRAAEAAAVKQADADGAGAGGKSTALVLTDRSARVGLAVKEAYPWTRPARATYSGTGYRDGHSAGQRADIGGAKVGAGSAGAISR